MKNYQSKRYKCNYVIVMKQPLYGTTVTIFMTMMRWKIHFWISQFRINPRLPPQLMKLKKAQTQVNQGFEPLSNSAGDRNRTGTGD